MSTDRPAGFAEHDHADCVAGGVAAAERLCDERGLRLTPVRRRVLELLLARHRALGAYDLLEVLRAEGLAAQPPAIYRALDFLVAHGLAHRIERRNAFVACADPAHAHVPAFLICRACERVAEAPADGAAEMVAARVPGFAPERTVMEAEGLCPRCRDGGAA